MRSAMAVIVNGPPRRGDDQRALALAEALDDARRGAPAPRRRTSGRCARSAATRRPRRPAATGAAPKCSRPISQQFRLGVAAAESRGWRRTNSAKRLVDRDAEIGAAGVGVELVERPQPQDMAGIDRVGIAQPGLDLRHRQLARPRRERRARRGGRLRAAVRRGWSRAGGGRGDLRVGPERAARARPRAAPCRAATASATARSARPRAAPRGSAPPPARRAPGRNRARRCRSRAPARRCRIRARICRDIHGS